MNNHSKVVLLGVSAVSVALLAGWSLSFYQEIPCYGHESGPGSCLIEDSNLRTVVDGIVIGIFLFGLSLVAGGAFTYLRYKIVRHKKTDTSRTTYKSLGVLGSVYILLWVIVWLLLDANSSVVFLVYGLLATGVLLLPIVAAVKTVRLLTQSGR